MPSAICRCGHPLALPTDGSERVVCPNCNARVRIRRPAANGSGAVGDGAAGSDGFIRFHCPCGRRLKVSIADKPTHGKCPDCSRVVPIPENSTAAAEAEGMRPRTAELTTEQLAGLERWAKDVADRTSVESPDDTTTVLGTPNSPKVEAGLRTCPSCGRPIHMAATICRECGSPTPKR